MCLTCSSSCVGSDQSSEGDWSHVVRAPGIARLDAFWMRASSSGPVEDALERLSARTAEGVDMRGRCWMVTLHPRKHAMRWMARIIIEADSSFRILRGSQPNTTAWLSVSSRTSLPAMEAGQHTKGRRAAAQSAAVVEESGTASGQRVVLSTTVKR